MKLPTSFTITCIILSEASDCARAEGYSLSFAYKIK